MNSPKDIETLDDCRALVEGFYEAARADALLGPVFATRLARSWPDHLEAMTWFWGAILSRSRSTTGVRSSVTPACPSTTSA